MLPHQCSISLWPYLGTKDLILIFIQNVPFHTKMWYLVMSIVVWSLSMQHFTEITIEILASHLITKCYLFDRCQRSRRSVYWWRSCLTTDWEISSNKGLRNFIWSSTSWKDLCRQVIRFFSNYNYKIVRNVSRKKYIVEK